MATYVLVHGAWGGSYYWAPIADALRKAGHRVYAPSLTGLGERAHLAHGGITLSEHIEDVVGTIESERLSDIILVGHSYGGMVTTGVAARCGGRIDALVYLDAFLPEDGQSLWDIADDTARTLYIDGQRGTPGLCQPFFPIGERRMTGHPLLTLLEPVKLGGEEDRIPRRSYVYATKDAPTIFTKFRDRVQGQAGWNVHELATGHMLWDEDFEGVLGILLQAAER